MRHRSPQKPLVSCDPKLGVDTEETEGGKEEVVEKSLDWNDITNLLGQNLNPEAFDKRLRYAHAHALEFSFVLFFIPHCTTESPSSTESLRGTIMKQEVMETVFLETKSLRDLRVCR